MTIPTVTVRPRGTKRLGPLVEKDRYRWRFKYLLDHAGAPEWLLWIAVSQLSRVRSPDGDYFVVTDEGLERAKNHPSAVHLAVGADR